MRKKFGFMAIATIFCLTFALTSTVMADIRTATFDSIITGTDLTAYTEGSLKISTPKLAYVDYIAIDSGGFPFPSAAPTYPGFSGGFFYPAGGINGTPITITTTDAVHMYDVKFNAGSGQPDNPNVDLFWNIWSSGGVVSTGNSTVLKGTQVDFSYNSGFDSIDVYGGQSISSNNFTRASNSLALDNLIVNTSAATSVPEPTTMLLLGLGLAGLAGVRRKFGN